MLEDLERRLRASVEKPNAIAWGAMRGSETLALGATNGVTPDTPFALASITKPITATAVMILVERGLVDLDAPISDYLEVPLSGRAGAPRGATVRRVLSHTAGLPLHYQFFYADEPFAPPPFAETLRRYGKTFSPPGSRYLYSNLGYGLLDSAIERVSGRSFAAFVLEEIFEPLGMVHASIGPSAGAAVPQGQGFAYPPYGFDHPGGSAAFASVDDLLRFGRFHLGHDPSLLRPGSLKMMREGEAYGLGWGLDARGFFGHSGSMGGVRTALRMDPAHDLVLVALANFESDLPFRVVDAAHTAWVPALPPAPHVEPRESLLPAGVWSGRVETHAGDRPLALTLGAEPRARLAGIEAPLESAAFRDGRIVGVFDGDLDVDDANRRPYRLHLDLVPDGSRLRGAVVAISTQEPGQRLGNALSSWCTLEPEGQAA